MIQHALLDLKNKDPSKKENNSGSKLYKSSNTSIPV